MGQVDDMKILEKTQYLKVKEQDQHSASEVLGIILRDEEIILSDAIQEEDRIRDSWVY